MHEESKGLDISYPYVQMIIVCYYDNYLTPRKGS